MGHKAGSGFGGTAVVGNAIVTLLEVGSVVLGNAIGSVRADPPKLARLWSRSQAFQNELLPLGFC